MAEKDWSNCDSGDVVLETKEETRCALASLVAIEALRREDEDVDWWSGSAGKLLGHFDNLLACARILADHQAALLDYIDQETDALHAAYMAKGPAHESFPAGLYAITGELVLHGDSQIVACLPNNEHWHAWVPESGPPVLYRNLTIEAARGLKT